MAWRGYIFGTSHDGFTSSALSWQSVPARSRACGRLTIGSEVKITKARESRRVCCSSQYNLLRKHDAKGTFRFVNPEGEKVEPDLGSAQRVG